MPDALEPVEVGQQELAAPEGAVDAVAEPVEREPEHRFRATVLHHARGDVRVVVLHGRRRQVEVERELGRQVLRVEVVRDHLREHAVQRAGDGRRPAGTTGRSPGARGRRCGGWRRRRRHA